MVNRTSPVHPTVATRSASATYCLRDLIGTGSVVGFNVGPSGEVCLLIALASLDYHTPDNGFASFPKITPDAPQRYRVLIVRKGQVVLDLIVENDPFNLHDLQPLGTSLLLINARSEYRGTGDFDRNGRVYSREGVFLREFLLGDGIETVQATHQGEIWAAYFDEGVFGNFGWSDPVGAAGLVAWDEMGEKTYDYAPEGRAESIADCYALNVATDDDVWCCYYPDFRLVHLHKKQTQSIWEVPIKGSSAFAIENNYALFAGGYQNRDTFELMQLKTKGKASAIDHFQLLDAQGELVKVERVVGRGNTLYILSKGMLFELTLGAMLSPNTLCTQSHAEDS